MFTQRELSSWLLWWAEAARSHSVDVDMGCRLTEEPPRRNPSSGWQRNTVVELSGKWQDLWSRCNAYNIYVHLSSQHIPAPTNMQQTSRFGVTLLGSVSALSVQLHSTSWISALCSAIIRYIRLFVWRTRLPALAYVYRMGVFISSFIYVSCNDSCV
jgi:hypothetical protein